MINQLPPPQAFPLTVRTLVISTHLRLHRDFVADPIRFAHRHGVQIPDDKVIPDTSYKKDPDEGGKIGTSKANVHLVAYGAIRLFIQQEENDSWIQSIKLDPSVLLELQHGRAPTQRDVVLALSVLKAAVAPLLADSEQERHIVPGLAVDNQSVAYWSRIECDLLLPGIQLNRLHDLSHPATRPAEGASEERLELKRKDADMIIRFDRVSSTAIGAARMDAAEGVRVGVHLRGDTLCVQFRNWGTFAEIKSTKRLVRFRISDLDNVCHAVTSGLEGFYLPPPIEWASMGKPLTPAKVLALVGATTQIPLAELHGMYLSIRQPKEKACNELQIQLEAVTPFLKPVPVSTLFPPGAWISHAEELDPSDDERIDPEVAAAYGSG